ncbi:MAG: TVP38/TMEM64 family protein [Caldilineaceae bacterium]
MSVDSSTAPKVSLLQQHGQKIVAAIFWLLLIGGYTYYYQTNNLTTETAILEIVDLLSSPLGPLIYILLYTARPLIFFSAAVLTIASGSIFGAGSIVNLTLAVLYTIIGSNLSATVAYLVGRFFGEGLIKETKEEGANLIQRYADRMRKNSFETILIMRFIFLPYDLVNYLAGILRIDWKSFIVATILGSIPGTIAFVSFGASIDVKQLARGETPDFNPWVLLFGGVILVISIFIRAFLNSANSASPHGREFPTTRQQDRTGSPWDQNQLFR